jgi:nicotinamide-nucleotide amidase
MLGIDPLEIERRGAVSREVALAMATGALAKSHADVAVSITGFAGPAGEGDEVGLVHLAAASGARTLHRECHFGNRSREAIRQLAVRSALEMLDEITGE